MWTTQWLGLPEEEQVALTLLEQALEASVFEVDENTGVQRVDGRFRFRDGRTGAVEVTRIVDPRRASTDAALAGSALQDWGTRHAWIVVVRPGTPVKHLRRQVMPVLAACEAAGVDRIDAYSVYGPAPFARSLFDRGITARVAPYSSEPGVRVLQQLIAGAVDHQFESLTDWLSDALVEDHLAGKVSKLAAAKADERHLFLWLGDDDKTSHLASALTVPTPTGEELLPTRRLAKVQGADSLWIAPWVPGRVLRWDGAWSSGTWSWEGGEARWAWR